MLCTALAKKKKKTRRFSVVHHTSTSKDQLFILWYLWVAVTDRQATLSVITQTRCEPFYRKYWRSYFL